MASNRRLSKWRSFFWLLVIVGVAIGIGNKAEHIDSLLYNYAGKLLGYVPQERTLYLLHSGQTAPREQDTTSQSTQQEFPRVGAVEVDDASAAGCFAALPLGPQDTAVLLNKLTAQGVRHLAVSAPFTWQNPPAIARQMVAMRLGAFSSVAVGLRGRTAAEADFTPTVLRSWAIPSDHIEGDTSGLPAANRAVENDLYQTPEAANLGWAPDRLEEERLTQNPGHPTDRTFPLLARWNGEIFPTLPLRLAMQIKGLTPADLRVRIGRDIRLGNITLPLDERGRTRLTRAEAVVCQLADVVDGKVPTSKQTPIMLMAQPAGGKAEPERVKQLAATISQLCVSETVLHHTHPGAPGLSLQYRNPASGWLHLSILAVFALFAVRVLPFFYAIFRHLIMLAALGGILWLANDMMQQGAWFHLTTALCTWLTLAIALRFLHPSEVRSRRRR
ncbi:MAG: hypothetical protein IJN29_03180 [Akkermansia sp.]|nr:hypothetical protein [Akkermansia sp.]